MIRILSIISIMDINRICSISIGIGIGIGIGISIMSVKLDVHHSGNILLKR